MYYDKRRKNMFIDALVEKDLLLYEGTLYEYLKNLMD